MNNMILNTPDPGNIAIAISYDRRTGRTWLNRDSEGISLPIDGGGHVTETILLVDLNPTASRIGQGFTVTQIDRLDNSFSMQFTEEANGAWSASCNDETGRSIAE